MYKAAASILEIIWKAYKEIKDRVLFEKLFYTAENLITLNIHENIVRSSFIDLTIRNEKNSPTLFENNIVFIHYYITIFQNSSATRKYLSVTLG